MTEAISTVKPAENPLTMETFVNQTLDDIFSACTRCGRCVEVCPTVPFSGLSDAAPKDVISDVLSSLRDDVTMSADADKWISTCNGCGDCIPACPEDINVRQLISMANSKVAKNKDKTPYAFRKMARAIRIMVGMQLVPDDVARLLRPKAVRDADVIFYTGCNPIRTPHVLFNVMTMLDELDVDYEVMGGTSACCGVVHSKWEGDLKTGGRVTERTLHKFGDFKPQKVLNWCPTCQIHLTETLKGYRKVEFSFDHITKFLLEREEELISRFTTPVNMQVAVHTHSGVPEVGAAVMRLLRAVPGLTIVEELQEPAYMCGASGSEKALEMKEHYRAKTVERSKSDDIDALVTLYHACHLQLSSDGRKHGFQTINYTDILVRAMGLEPCPDTVEPYRAIGEWEQMVHEAKPYLEANNIDIDTEELIAVLPEVFTSAEFKGGLCRFAPQA